jgi:hypothetical protein
MKVRPGLKLLIKLAWVAITLTIGILGFIAITLILKS